MCASPGTHEVTAISGNLGRFGPIFRYQSLARVFGQMPNSKELKDPRTLLRAVCIECRRLFDPRVAALNKSASGAGLKAKAAQLTWNRVNQLKKALPAIVRLEHGGYMVLLRLEGIGDTVRLVLQRSRCWRRCLAFDRSGVVREGLDGRNCPRQTQLREQHDRIICLCSA